MISLEHIKISLGEVSNLANQIRQINANLDDILRYVKQLMLELNTIWDSDGARAIQMRFAQFSNRFVEESETIEKYAHFLDYTVSSYDNLETTIESNAQEFN